MFHILFNFLQVVHRSSHGENRYIWTRRVFPDAVRTDTSEHNHSSCGENRYVWTRYAFPDVNWSTKARTEIITYIADLKFYFSPVYVRKMFLNYTLYILWLLCLLVNFASLLCRPCVNFVSTLCHFCAYFVNFALILCVLSVDFVSLLCRLCQLCVNFAWALCHLCVHFVSTCTLWILCITSCIVCWQK
jgi:hypothetical protein